MNSDTATTERTSNGMTGGVADSTIRNEDIAEGERATKENLTESGILFLNSKRTFDEYQEASLASIRRSQQQFDLTMAQTQANLAQINQITLQHLQNSVQVTHVANLNTTEAANKTMNRAGRHDDLAADAQWNPVQQGAADTLTAASYPANRAVDVASAGVATANEAVAAAVSTALTTALTPLLATQQQILALLTAQAGVSAKA